MIAKNVVSSREIREAMAMYKKWTVFLTDVVAIIVVLNDELLYKSGFEMLNLYKENDYV